MQGASVMTVRCSRPGEMVFITNLGNVHSRTVGHSSRIIARVPGCVMQQKE